MHTSYRTFPKLPFPRTIKKLKSESFIRSLLPLLSNLEMAFVVFSSTALEPVPILALCKDRDKNYWKGHGGVVIKTLNCPQNPKDVLRSSCCPQIPMDALRPKPHTIDEEHSMF